MRVYRTNSGKSEVRQAVRRIYDQCPVPAESIELETRDFGVTHVLAAGLTHDGTTHDGTTHDGTTDAGRRKIDSRKSSPGSGNSARREVPLSGPSGLKPSSILLLHGTSSNSASWFGYLPDWTCNFRVYLIDIPGQPGLSGEERPVLNDGSYVRWLQQVVELLGIGRFHLCGQSLGGLIALQYAARHHDSLDGLALISPSGLYPPRISFLFRILPYLFLGDRGTRKINRIVSGKVPVDPRFEEFSLLTARYFIPLTGTVPVLTDEELMGIDCSVLYIAGAEDALLNTARSAARLGTLLSRAEIRILENVGHVVFDQEGMLESFFLQTRQTAEVRS